jgi:hypothetical protein
MPERGDAKARWSKADDQVSPLAVRLPPLAVPAQQARLLRSDLPGFSGAGAGVTRFQGKGAWHQSQTRAHGAPANGRQRGAVTLRAFAHPPQPTERVAD